jgi:O-succinylbenzoate synthase
MPYQLQFRRYRLPLRTPVRTAHERWTEREGLLVRLEEETGRAAFGEVAPIPAFGTESVEAAESALQTLGSEPGDVALDSVPAQLGCLRQALATARFRLREPALRTSVGTASPATATASTPAPATTETAPGYRAVAALLPAGRAVLEAIPGKLEMGFRIFKWKVGVGDAADELALLDDLCATLPKGGRLRLDANGAWDRRTAERWLERCAERPVEFVEQPCFAPASDRTSARRAEDTMRGLAADFPTPLALDESLVNEGDVERWLATGWPGWFVVKPSLLGDIDAALQKLAVAKATVVFSSALETAVGAQAALRVAFAWSGEPKALGFGVWPLFEDYRFDGPAAAPFIRIEDVERIDPVALWNALA